MPFNNNQGGKKPYTGGKSAPKSSAQREGHRGYRPEAAGAAAPKKRWTPDDRAARTGDRTGNSAGRPARESNRPEWSPREKPARPA